MSQVDIRKALKYPPEVFMGTVIKDLSGGLNNIVVYTGLDVAKLFAGLVGFSSTAASNVALDVTRDGVSGYATVSDLGAVRGLDYMEELKVGALRDLIVRARAISSVSNFTFRYLIKVSPVKAVHKLLYGGSLLPREKAVAEKLGLTESTVAFPVDVWNPYKGVLDVKFQATSVSTTGVVLRVTPPGGYKAVLLGIASERPTAPNSFKIYVSRDGIENIMELDAYGLPTQTTWWGSPAWNTMRVVALDELLIEGEVLSGGPYNVRIVYGLAPINIVEKIAWGLELTDEEERIAEKHRLYDMVEAGLIP